MSFDQDSGSLKQEIPIEINEEIVINEDIKNELLEESIDTIPRSENVENDQTGVRARVLGISEFGKIMFPGGGDTPIPEDTRKCPKCDLSFHSVHGVNDHFREKHDTKCSKCDIDFSTVNEWYKHYNETHKISKFYPVHCSRCDMGFFTIKELNDHYNKTHSENTELENEISISHEEIDQMNTHWCSVFNTKKSIIEEIFICEGISRRNCKASFHPSDNMRCYILRDTLSQAAKFTNKNSPYINHDLETRPKKSYVQLIAEALFSAPGGVLTLQEIYLATNINHPFYKMNEKGWQNSIRHNLSLNKNFEKVSFRLKEMRGAWKISENSLRKSLRLKCNNCATKGIEIGYRNTQIGYNKGKTSNEKIDNNTRYMKVDNTCSILPDYEQNSHCEGIMEKKEVESEDHKIKILKKKVLKLQRVGLKSVYQETEVYESNHTDFKEIKIEANCSEEEEEESILGF